MQSTGGSIGTWRRFLIVLFVISGMLATLSSPPATRAFGAPASRGGKGAVWGWGSNRFVELAFNDVPQYPNPLANTGIGAVVGISIGGWFSLAMRDDGTLWSWGNNSYGSLGDGTTISRFTAQPVLGLGPVVGFSAGDAHALAVTTDGKVWSWGWNAYGQLGIGVAGTDRRSPVPVEGPGGTGQLSGVVSVAAAGGYSAALKDDGTVWAWGDNSVGELGNSQVGPQSSVPVQVENLTAVAAISLGGGQSLALKKDGTVYAWGLNTAGQVGDGTTTNRFAAVPVKDAASVGTLSRVKAIATGTAFSLALMQDGTVYAWGFNGTGQLGIGPGGNQALPVHVLALPNTGQAILHDVVAISASINASGSGHSLALIGDGTVAAWGDNFFGQLGDGTSGNDRYTPVQVQLTGVPGGPLSHVIAISAGYASSLAIVGPGFGDLDGLPADAANAITQLAARGVIKGCDQTVSPPLFCPTDHSLRAQMAALIVRAVGWSAEAPSNAFTDQCDPTNAQNCVDNELWNDVGILAAKEVAKGYTDAATCAPAAAPCYAARDDVLHAQVISFITRAMVKKGYWTQATTDDSTVYPNIPAASGHRLDFVTYVANVGPVPGTTSATQNFADWNTPSTRAWFAEALWLAIQNH
jgi:alpha-tubulin suppressor-like RCC1 family protein